jgi:sugar-specific transcriptional regulator TrmB
VIAAVVLLAACESTYYSAMEKIGSHKRDILVDRIEDTQEAQEDTQQQFKDALEQYRSIVQFDGGNLQSMYNKLNSEFEDSESAAQGITDHIDSVENVAEDLFAEWNQELKLYTSSSLRREMQSRLTSTKREYSQMLAAMRKAEKSTVPVLNSMRYQVLYLNNSLNIRVIASIKGELAAIDSDVSRLIANMQKSIDESNRFIEKIKDQ